MKKTGSLVIGMMSNRSKRYLGVRYAKLYDLDYKAVYWFLKEKEISNEIELRRCLDEARHNHAFDRT